MNRGQRRAAKSKARKQPMAPAPPATKAPDHRHAPAAAAKSRPRFFLRIVAKVILSPFVLERVRSREVERLLASVAIEVGKPEIANSLLRRQQMREARGR